jgi:ferredoxin-nitrite reductase
VGFNVVVGGYMSMKRISESVPLDLWVPADVKSSVALCEAILRLFRDESNRKDRQKARLMWLVEEYGPEAFAAAVKKEIESYDRGVTIAGEQPHDKSPFERRELLGVHDQSNGAKRVGIHVPAGRWSVEELRHMADLADRYSNGEIRLTVEQNAMLPNVAPDKIKALLAEPALTLGRMSVNPGNIVGPMVSCTGAQFCPLAIVETKQTAEAVMAKVDALVEAPRPIRVHWTGCPNSCGQVQAADIGLMGAPAKREGEDGKMKAVSGAKIFLGGTIGEGGHLSYDPSLTGIPIDDQDEIAETIADLIVENYGGVLKNPRPKVGAVVEVDAAVFGEAWAAAEEKGGKKTFRGTIAATPPNNDGHWNVKFDDDGETFSVEASHLTLVGKESESKKEAGASSDKPAPANNVVPIGAGSVEPAPDSAPVEKAPA